MAPVQRSAFKPYRQKAAHFHIAVIDEWQCGFKGSPVIIAPFLILVDDVGMMSFRQCRGLCVTTPDTLGIEALPQHRAVKKVGLVKRGKQGHVIKVWQRPSQSQNGEKTKAGKGEEPHYDVLLWRKFMAGCSRPSSRIGRSAANQGTAGASAPGGALSRSGAHSPTPRMAPMSLVRRCGSRRA